MSAGLWKCACRLWALVGLTLGMAACGTVAPATQRHRIATPPSPVILISIDGLRWSDLGRGDTPTLERLAAGGASGALTPSFPSLTFPNHWTLVTGVEPDRHGIIANSFRDPVLGEFHMSETHEAFWSGAEPLWVSAERANVRTATMFWPGSETSIDGVRPTYWRPFDREVSDLDRTQQVLDWLDLPAVQRPKLITLYFNAVDRAGHRYGPDAPETRLAIRLVDAAVEALLAGLQTRGLAGNALLVVVSDHGMAQTSPERVIWLDDLIDPTALRVTYAGALLLADPVSGREAEAELALTSPRDHIACWRKDRIPQRFHYGAHPRVPRLVCLLDSGWLISERSRPPTRYGGAHGYEPRSKDMQAVFIAYGSAIARGRRLDALDSVDIHPFMVRMLDIPAPIGDGNVEHTRRAIRP